MRNIHVRRLIIGIHLASPSERKHSIVYDIRVCRYACKGEKVDTSRNRTLEESFKKHYPFINTYGRTRVDHVSSVSCESVYAIICIPDYSVSPAINNSSAVLRNLKLGGASRLITVILEINFHLVKPWTNVS